MNTPYLLLIAFAGYTCLLYLLRIYSPARSDAKSVGSLEPLENVTMKRLFLASVVGLFLEMLLIRWVSSEIRVFAYFKNFVLIACFLGFGLGCYLYRRRINLLPMLLPLAILVLTIQLPWESLRDLITDLPTFVGATSDVHVWELPQLESGLLGLGALVGAIL